MSSRSAIAVFDVGKTNKKVFIFDEEYKIVREKTFQLAETKDEDGDPCEDIEALQKWIHHERVGLSTFSDYQLKAINFSAYGASLVHLNKQGKPVCPLYNYLKEYPERLQNEFYQKYGGREIFSSVAASPPMGSLNSGLQLYRLKYEKEELFDQINYSLHLPQWLSFLFSGKPYSDITSIGCHTAMWNFPLNQYHEWLQKEGVSSKLAPIFRFDTTIPFELKGAPIAAGIGLHDSSSALIPYLVSYKEPFVLLSTGTWCISLNPFDQSKLTVDDLSRDCLCYMDYHGNPVKASRLFSGYEHEKQTERIAEHFHVQKNHYKSLHFDNKVISKLKLRSTLEQKPDKARTHPFIFAQRDLSVFEDCAEAYYQLMRDLVEEQIVSTNLVLHDVKRLFVDGGFSKNSIYMNLLANALPGLEVYATDVPEGSAIGAAIAIHDKWNSNPMPRNFAGIKRYECHL